eukprot:599676-Rhodomonas_salina.3
MPTLWLCCQFSCRNSNTYDQHQRLDSLHYITEVSCAVPPSVTPKSTRKHIPGALSRLGAQGIECCDETFYRKVRVPSYLSPPNAIR